jgi:DNA-binding protein H-NS
MSKWDLEKDQKKKKLGTASKEQKEGMDWTGRGLNPRPPASLMQSGRSTTELHALLMI